MFQEMRRNRQLMSTEDTDSVLKKVLKRVLACLG